MLKWLKPKQECEIPMCLYEHRLNYKYRYPSSGYLKEAFVYSQREAPVCCEK
jgi:hypothetical protein